MQEAQFNHSVGMAMNRITENLSRDQRICMEVSNCLREGGSCYLLMKNREEWASMGTMIRKDLNYYGINLDFEFDAENQTLTGNGNSRRLTLKESRILKLLASSGGNLVKREEVMIEVWGESDYYTGRSLDVFVSKIRGYLREDPSISITTIPTVGYILEIKPK